MRKALALLALVALLAGVTATAAFAVTKVPWKVGARKTITIRHGSKVTWVWADSKPHNVKGKGFHSAIKTKRGYTYSHVFRTKGKFTVICQVHSNMKTIVKVG